MTTKYKTSGFEATHTITFRHIDAGHRVVYNIIALDDDSAYKYAQELAGYSLEVMNVDKANLGDVVGRQI